MVFACLILYCYGLLLLLVAFDYCSVGLFCVVYIVVVLAFVV